MRKKVGLIHLAVLAIGFLDILSVAAQDTSRIADGSVQDLKPCVVIMGAVRAPSRVEIQRVIRLHELLTSAGGVTERAEGNIQIIHTGLKCFAGSTENGRRKPLAPESEKITVVKLAEVQGGDKNADIYISA